MLNDATHHYRMNGGAPDPQGKVLYTTTTQITKLADRYEIGKPKYTIIDLTQQKISKTVDEPTEHRRGRRRIGGGGGRGGGAFEVSPDGKYLYQFGSNITVLNSADFSVVDHIQLSQPEAPSMEGMGLGGVQEALSDAGPARLALQFFGPHHSQPRLRPGAFRSEYQKVRFHAHRPRAGHDGTVAPHAGR